MRERERSREKQKGILGGNKVRSEERGEKRREKNLRGTHTHTQQPTTPFPPAHSPFSHTEEKTDRDSQKGSALKLSEQGRGGRGESERGERERVRDERERKRRDG